VLIEGLPLLSVKVLDDSRGVAAQLIKEPSSSRKGLIRSMAVFCQGEALFLASLSFVTWR
jgi:hypothetical protein